VILQRTGSCPMNAITLDFLQEIVIPNLFKVLFKVNTPLCTLRSAYEENICYT
jgi:hypothetical protein